MPMHKKTTACCSKQTKISPFKMIILSIFCARPIRQMHDKPGDAIFVETCGIVPQIVSYFSRNDLLLLKNTLTGIYIKTYN